MPQKATVKFKADVRKPNGIRPEISRAIDIASEIWGEWVTELWVTSLNDGTHKVNSFHYRDLAVDLRTKNLPTTEVKKLALLKLVKRLGKDYDVILEYLGKDREHMHVEYDP